METYLTKAQIDIAQMVELSPIKRFVPGSIPGIKNEGITGRLSCGAIFVLKEEVKCLKDY